MMACELGVAREIGTIQEINVRSWNRWDLGWVRVLREMKVSRMTPVSG